MAGRQETTAPAADWPLGQYLHEARGDMSRREAARRAGISESRYRQVELGYQTMTAGVNAPVQPTAKTVAAMAHAVGADVGKAFKLAGIDGKRYPELLDPPSQPVTGLDGAHEWFRGLDSQTREQVIMQLQRLHVQLEVAEQIRGTG